MSATAAAHGSAWTQALLVQPLAAEVAAHHRSGEKHPTAPRGGASISPIRRVLSRRLVSRRPTMRHKTSGGVILFVCLLGAGLPSRATAQGVGAIGGTLTDPSGAVLPGATVTLVSPGTVGGNQEVVTNERGAYQFTRLVPGRYGVRAE